MVHFYYYPEESCLSILKCVLIFVTLSSLHSLQEVFLPLVLFLGKMRLNTEENAKVSWSDVPIEDIFSGKFTPVCPWDGVHAAITCNVLTPMRSKSPHGS